MVYELCRDGDKIFVARPRRFGKSLLLSTFESLFKYGLRDFHGLDIENLWNDSTYSVLRLDFSLAKDYSTVEDFLQRFDTLLRDAVREAGLCMSSEGTDPIGKFSALLSSLPHLSLVLLIDEYDAPLTSRLDDPILFDAVQQKLSQFYSTVKSYEGRLRFFFMTGITKFSNTSIFSAFNNIRDISLDPKFGALLGYTEEEIRRWFGGHLRRAAGCLNLSEENVLSGLRENYDGFCFDSKGQTHVYCPWSVLNFLTSPHLGFANYWFRSGGQPAVLMRYLDGHELADPASYGADLLVPLSALDASAGYDDLKAEVLLTQAGYLTVKHACDDGFVQLGYPNKEVSRSMAELYASQLLKNRRLLRAGSTPVSAVLKVGTAEEVVRVFNEAVDAIDYQRYPIRDEASCRAYLQVLLLGAAMLPQVEVHSALGRCDMLVNIDKRRWVFEFKYAGRSSDAAACLEAAKSQMTSRRYGGQDAGKELIRIALVFSGEERQFVSWCRV